MEKRTMLWLVGAIVIITAAVILLRFVKTNGDAISSMPGSASNWFQQFGTSHGKDVEEPVIIIQQKN